MGHCWSVPKKRSKFEEKIDDETVDIIAKQTGLNLSDLQNNYNDFIQKYPNGQLTKEQFSDVFDKFFQRDVSEENAETLFNKFDQDQSGTIDFRECMIALSSLSREPLVQKLSLAFYLYDENGDGILSYPEVLGIVKAICYVTKTQNKKQEVTPEPEEVAKNLFSELDVDKDGQVTLDEFTKVACHDRTVADMLLATKDDRRVFEDLKLT